MHLLLIQTSPYSKGLNFICATDRNIVSSQKKLHSLLLSSKLCNCKNNEGFQWVLQLSFCNEIQWKHGTQGFLPSLQNHRASWQYSYIYANPRTNSKRRERNSIFAWSVCAVCFFVLLLQGSSPAHILLLCFPFSGLHTSYTAAADRFLLKWKTVHMYMLLAKPINLDISKIWPPPIT